MLASFDNFAITLKFVIVNMASITFTQETSFFRVSIRVRHLTVYLNGSAAATVVNTGWFPSDHILYNCPRDDVAISIEILPSNSTARTRMSSGQMLDDTVWCSHEEAWEAATADKSNQLAGARTVSKEAEIEILRAFRRAVVRTVASDAGLLLKLKKGISSVDPPIWDKVMYDMMEES